MADLESLIRVRKHVVDQKQKFLADLYQEAESLRSHKVELEERFDEERKSVEQLGVQMLSYFGPYSKAVKMRVEAIDGAMVKLETRIEIARDDIRAAFAELKKVEITHERREAEERAAIDKKESNEMDDIGVEIFRRKQVEEEAL